MPSRIPSKEKVQQLIDAYARLSPEHRENWNMAERALGIDHSTIKRYVLTYAPKYGIQVPDIQGKLPDLEVSAALVSRERQRYEDQISTLRTQLRDAHRELNELEDTRRALFGLVSEPIRIPKWSLIESRKGNDVEMPILFTSDWQYGETISKERIGGWNEFNPDIADDRIRLLISKTIELSFQHRGNKKYPGIYYLRGGDQISGELHTLRETNALQSGSAARRLVQSEVWAIGELRKAFGKVHVLTVPGNHGRTTFKPDSKENHSDNWDVVTHYWLETAFADDKNVSFDAPASKEALFNIYGHQFCLTHGDRIGSSGGQGFIGPTATILRGMKKTFDHYASLGIILDYILVGHFHTPGQNEYGFSNGCLPGFSEYAQQFKMRPTPPQQWLLFVHPDHGVCDSKALILGKRPKLSQ